MKIIEGKLTANGLKIAIVVARFNELLTDPLCSGAVDTFVRHGGDKENITVVHVPGAFEIPLAAKKAATLGKFDAIVCLGAVIRGSTPHFDYVCSQAASGCTSVGLETGVPVAFGVITTDTIEQAIERSGTKAGNKGREAMITAIEMANLLTEFS